MSDAARIERQRAVRAVALVAVIAAGFVGANAFATEWPAARALLASRGTGWIAAAALLLAASTTSLARVAARSGASWVTGARVSALRRALGMTAACVAVAHAAVAMSSSLGGELVALWTWGHLRSGVVALFVLALLWLTSFERVVQRLRLHTWKELHRLSYVAVLLVLHHVLLAPFASLRVTLAVFGITFVSWVARVAIR